MLEKRNTLTPFGRRVKKRLIDMGMTNRDLCRAIGCTSPTYLNDMLSGRRNGEKYRDLICEILKMPCEQNARRA